MTWAAVEQVREAHAKAMEALAADVHPYSASAVRDWETGLDAALQLLEDTLEAAATAGTALERATFDAHDREWARETQNTLRAALARARTGAA